CTTVVLILGSIQTFASAEAGDQSDPDHGQDHLDEQLGPVHARGVTNADLTGDEATQQRGHNADHDGQQHRDVLTAGQQAPDQHADDGADDDCGDNAGSGHVSSWNSVLPEHGLPEAMCRQTNDLRSTMRAASTNALSIVPNASGGGSTRDTHRKAEASLG